MKQVFRFPSRQVIGDFCKMMFTILSLTERKEWFCSTTNFRNNAGYMKKINHFKAVKAKTLVIVETL